MAITWSDDPKEGIGDLWFCFVDTAFPQGDLVHLSGREFKDMMNEAGDCPDINDIDDDQDIVLRPSEDLRTAAENFIYVLGVIGVDIRKEYDIDEEWLTMEWHKRQKGGE